MAKRLEETQKLRRRPVQSRSRETARAIRDAFVRLLAEKPYPQVTIREIVMVAGVGLGTFYEYFDSKDALARACVHLRTKELLRALARRRAPVVAGLGPDVRGGFMGSWETWITSLCTAIAGIVGTSARSPIAVRWLPNTRTRVGYLASPTAL